jgi:hypothetical protein
MEEGGGWRRGGIVEGGRGMKVQKVGRRDACREGGGWKESRRSGAWTKGEGIHGGIERGRKGGNDECMEREMDRLAGGREGQMDGQTDAQRKGGRDRWTE